MPSLPFLRGSLDRERDRDHSRERLPVSPPQNAQSRLAQQQAASSSSTAGPSSASGSNAITPTRSFSDRLLRRKPSLSSKHGSAGSVSLASASIGAGGSGSGAGTGASGAPPVPPLSAGLTEYSYDTASEPRTASTMGDVFADQQAASGSGTGAGLGLQDVDRRNGWMARPRRPSVGGSDSHTFEVNPLGQFTPRLPDSHPFDPRNEVRPPTPSSSKSGHAFVVPPVPSLRDRDDTRAVGTPPPRRNMPTSPTPNRNTPTPESSNSSGRIINSSAAEWLNRQPSRGKLRSSSHGSAAARPAVPPPPSGSALSYPERMRDPPPPLRHRSSPMHNTGSLRAQNYGQATGFAYGPDRMGELRELSSTDESHSDGEIDQNGPAGAAHRRQGSSSANGAGTGAAIGQAYEVSVSCGSASEDGEIKWEISIRPRRQSISTPSSSSSSSVAAHSHTLTPQLGKNTILAPSSASSINLSLALNQPTGKLVFIQFPTDVSTPSKRRIAKATSALSPSPIAAGRDRAASPGFAPHARQSTFGAAELGTPPKQRLVSGTSTNSGLGMAVGLGSGQGSPSPARAQGQMPVLGQPLQSQPDGPSPQDLPTEPPSLLRPETPPPRMQTPPPLPATPLSDARTPRRGPGHVRTGSRNMSGKASTPARTLNYSPPATPTRTGGEGSRSSIERILDDHDRVGITTTLNGELVGSPRGTTPRRHRIVSASQLNGGLYALGTVDGLSEDLESELVLGGELIPSAPPAEVGERHRTFGGRI